MSLRWTGGTSESGILRKSEFKEKKEELFVFGYSCKLFRDDEKAQQIDQGKHLIPWMGDETLKIDRYDARGALHDISRLEAPPGGYDWRVELTRTEKDVEQLCDEERYRALHTDEDEEEMYKEEELKRLHAAGYGQVGFNYDVKTTQEPAAVPVEVDEPFVPEPQYKELFDDTLLFPTTEKQNAIIEKTAKFIASQGAQMEILIKAKQGDNPQFQFLNRENELHPYYIALIANIKTGKWPLKIVEPIEERPHEHEDYLHPSLASTIIESAPSIPSIHYKPSADCDYTMLISKMRGDTTEGAYEQQLAPGEVAPPGTEPLPPRVHAEISRAPVMYTHGGSSTPPLVPPIPPPPIFPNAPPPAVPSVPPPLIMRTVPPPPIVPTVPYTAYHQQYTPNQAQLTAPPPALPAAPAVPSRSTGLSLMKNYNTDSGSDVSAPVSFSIKKLKEPEPVLPKPALPYESSSDEDSENKDKQTEENINNASPKPNSTPTLINNIPLQKVDGKDKLTDRNNDVKVVTKSINSLSAVTEVKTTRKDKTSMQAPPTKYSDLKLETEKHKKLDKSPKKISKRTKDKKSKSHKDKKDDRDKKRDKSKDRNSKDKSNTYKDDLESEIISLEDDVFIDLTGDPDSKADADESEREKQQERRQRAAAFLKAVGVEPTTPLPTSSLASAMVDTLETLRKKKADEEEKRRKKEKRRNREKQRYDEAMEKSHRKSKRRKHKSSDDDDTDHDNESPKKKKRKKEKKSSKSKKRRRKETEPDESEEEMDHTSLNIDVKSTLKGLRTSSPTKEVLQDLEVAHQGVPDSSSDREEEIEEPKKRRKTEEREYSEGECSVDSERDSESVASRNGEVEPMS